MSPDALFGCVHALRRCRHARVHLHSLRHFAATEMLAAGIDPRNAAEVLAHSNASLTLGLYGHARRERQRLAASVLGQVLNS
jgi:integrase